METSLKATLSNLVRLSLKIAFQTQLPCKEVMATKGQATITPSITPPLAIWIRASLPSRNAPAVRIITRAQLPKSPRLLTTNRDQQRNLSPKLVTAISRKWSPIRPTVQIMILMAKNRLKKKHLPAGQIKATLIGPIQISVVQYNKMLDSCIKMQLMREVAFLIHLSRIQISRGTTSHRRMMQQVPTN